MCEKTEDLKEVDYLSKSSELMERSDKFQIRPVGKLEGTYAYVTSDKTRSRGFFFYPGTPIPVPSSTSNVIFLTTIIQTAIFTTPLRFTIYFIGRLHDSAKPEEFPEFSRLSTEGTCNNKYSIVNTPKYKRRPDRED